MPLWFFVPCALYSRWDVDGHLQGYGRSVDVLFSAVGSYEVRPDSGDRSLVFDLELWIKLALPRVATAFLVWARAVC